jgi:hypothetical protein
MQYKQNKKKVSIYAEISTESLGGMTDALANSAKLQPYNCVLNKSTIYVIGHLFKILF